MHFKHAVFLNDGEIYLTLDWKGFLFDYWHVSNSEYRFPRSTVIIKKYRQLQLTIYHQPASDL